MHIAIGRTNLLLSLRSISRIKNEKSYSLISNFSTSSKENEKSLVLTSINSETSVATMTFNRPPVNTLSLEMCKEISKQLSNIDKNHPEIQSLIISSSNPQIFSAGLDITEMYKPDPKRLPEFWRSLQQVFIDLYSTRLATVAAMEGSAIAGGCMLAMSCDYRVMSNFSKNNIGLNETKLGIAAPRWFADLMIRTVGFREAEKAIALGTLYSPEKALQIGLVDEIVPNDEVLETATEHACRWAKIPPYGRVVGKKDMRGKFIDELLRDREEDINSFCSFVQQDYVQAGLGTYIKSLKAKVTK